MLHYSISSIQLQAGHIVNCLCLGLRSWEHFDDKKSHFSSMFNILGNCNLYTYMLTLNVILFLVQNI